MNRVGIRTARRGASGAVLAMVALVGVRSSLPVREAHRERSTRPTMPVWPRGASYAVGPVATPAMGAAVRPLPLGATAADSIGASGPPSAVAPVRVTIPSLGVDSGLDALGIETDGTIAVPNRFDRAGWFTGAPAPGQAGPAVILGHVDSWTGPAVFFRLRQIVPGASVVVARANGSHVSFRVTGLETVPKGAFPSAAVYGPVPDAELRLITCGGPFDARTGHYRDNVVVFASAVAGS